MRAVSDSFIVSEVTKHYACSSINSAIDRMVDDVLQKAGGSAGPVDLIKIATSLGVLKIEQRDIPCEAMLVPHSKSHYCIFVSPHSPPRRQRFSIAHEIAHILLHRIVPETRGFENRTVFTPPGGMAEERLCDAIAARLLMPTPQLIGMFADSEIEVEHAFYLASQFNVSVATAAIRLGEMAGKEVGLLEVVANARSGIIRKVSLRLPRQRAGEVCGRPESTLSVVASSERTTWAGRAAPVWIPVSQSSRLQCGISWRVLSRSASHTTALVLAWPFMVKRSLFAR